MTIDGVERTLDETVLVIADGNKPVAIAGVMGGLNTEVTASTKNILLEAALFNPVSLRRTSRKLGISTESSYRFERKIDPESVLYASSRAARLIVQHAGGVAGDVVERGTKGAPRRPIELVHSRLTATLGVDIPRESVKKALSSLGCRVKGGSKEMLTVEPPSFRNDVESEIDLIEEVARIFGYGKIPVTVPAIPLDYKPRLPLDRLLEERIGSLLAAEGLYEVLTYSLMSRRDLESAHLLDEAVVDIANPLSQEQESMRPSMIPGLLKVIEWNINRKARELGFFEIGALYRKGRPEGTPEGPSGGPHEERHLAIGLSGEVRGNWRSPAREADFFDLKGFLETVFGELGLRGAQFVRGERAMFSAGSSASISVDGTHIGYIGEIAKDVLARFDIKQKVYALELSIDEIAKRWAPHDRYIEPPKYPFVARDLSIVVDKAVENARIVRIIKERGGSIVRDVVLLDRYTGTQIPDGKVGLTYRIEYLDPSKTLEDGEVTSAHAAIYNGLVSEAGAAVR